MRLVHNPVLCNYYLTYRCNAKCSFCDIWEKPSPYVTLENVEHNLKDLKRLGVKIIDFTGGEPLLHRQLPEILDLAKKLGFVTTVTTNTLLYPKHAESLKGKVDMLHFSLDDPDPELHNLSRGVEIFPFFEQSIEIAKQLGERPDIIFTVFDHNIDKIDKVYKEYILPNQLMLILNPVFEYADIGEELSHDSVEKLKAWAGKKGVYLNTALLDLRANSGNQIEDPVCKAGSSTVVISPENELILPCYHLGLSNRAINNQLYDLWQSKEVQDEIKMEGRYEKCQGCTINCYMQPSFAVKINKYWWPSFKSSLKYN